MFLKSLALCILVWAVTSGRYVCEMYNPFKTPLLYRKTGVCKGLPILLFFLSKTLIVGKLACWNRPQYNVLNKNLKTSKFSNEILFFNTKKCKII